MRMVEQQGACEEQPQKKSQRLGSRGASENGEKSGLKHGRHEKRDEKWGSSVQTPLLISLVMGKIM